MHELMDEYGEVIIEVISGVLLLGIIGSSFLGSPIASMVQRFVTSVIGGGS